MVSSRNDDKADWREAWSLFPGSVAYVVACRSACQRCPTSSEASGFKIRCRNHLGKGQVWLCRGHTTGKPEPCWYAVKNGDA